MSNLQRKFNPNDTTWIFKVNAQVLKKPGMLNSEEYTANEIEEFIERGEFDATISLERIHDHEIPPSEVDKVFSRIAFHIPVTETTPQKIAIFLWWQQGFDLFVFSAVTRLIKEMFFPDTLPQNPIKKIAITTWEDDMFGDDTPRATPGFGKN